MKSAAGPIRLELAQYREMEVFTQFSSDLDEATKRQLAYGQGLMRLLRQPQYAPLSQHIPLNRMDEFRAGLLCALEEEAPDLCARIDQTGKLTQDDREEILELARGYLKDFQGGGKRGG